VQNVEEIFRRPVFRWPISTLQRLLKTPTF
jgi:hypothetical protein